MSKQYTTSTLSAIILPTELYLASIDLRYAIHYVAILNEAVMYPNENETLFCWTETNLEISLVVEKPYLDMCKRINIGLTTDENPFIAIQISIGEIVLTTDEIIFNVTCLLAKCNVSVYFISTFEVDYILCRKSVALYVVDVLRKEFNAVIDSSLIDHFSSECSENSLDPLASSGVKNRHLPMKLLPLECTVNKFENQEEMIFCKGVS